MRKKAILFVFLVGIFALFGNTLKAQEVYNLLEYYPVTDVGNKWLYKTHISLTEVEPFDCDTVVSVNNKEMLDGTEVYLLAINQPGGNEVQYYSLDEEGMYLKKINQEMRHGDVTVIFSPGLKIPIIYDLNNPEGAEETTAKTYDSNGGLIGEGTAKINIKFEGLENVSVPAGNFEDCLKIVLVTTIESINNSMSMTQTMWYAKGIGKVKEEKQQTSKAMTIDGQSMITETNIDMELKSATTGENEAGETAATNP